MGSLYEVGMFKEQSTFFLKGRSTPPSSRTPLNNNGSSLPMTTGYRRPESSPAHDPAPSPRPTPSLLTCRRPGSRPSNAPFARLPLGQTWMKFPIPRRRGWVLRARPSRRRRAELVRLLASLHLRSGRGAGSQARGSGPSLRAVEHRLCLRRELRGGALRAHGRRIVGSRGGISCKSSARVFPSTFVSRNRS